MKKLIEERIERWINDGIPMMAIFYSNVECGGQYGGLCFDSTKHFIKITDDYVWVYAEDSETIMNWDSIICIHIEML